MHFLSKNAVFLFAFEKNCAMLLFGTFSLTRSINKQKEEFTMARTKHRKTAKKAAARKTTRKLTAKSTRKATVRKSASLNVTKPLKKAQLYSHLADCTGVTRKEISGIFEALGEVIESHLKKGRPGEFTVPGLMKCKVIHKPATKARKGINPFTGEPTTFKAKPARNVIKVRPLKALKEMVN